jgi:hypothetical protein
VEFLYFIVLVALSIALYRQRSRTRELTERLRELTVRVYATEQTLAALHGEPLPEVVERAPYPHPAPPAMEAAPVVAEPPPLPEWVGLVPEPVAALSVEPPPVPPPPPGPTWRDRFQGEEWEALLGGSILNKLGALILVIGLALFLRFSLDALGPLGKIAVGLFIGGAMVAAGMWIERQPRYKIFSIGLLSGGWAMLYFTAFAAHGIPESRVIESPVLGLIVLLIVGALMVWRSLRYESEWVTGLAFFAAFAALQVDPGSAFAMVASALLAAGLLAISSRFGWRLMPLFGILLAYTTLAFLPPGVGWLPGIGHPILWVYWLLFELFDHWRARRAPLVSPLDAVQYVLNTMAFIAASLLTTRGAAPEHYSSFLGLAAVAFAVSAFFRRHRAVDEPDTRWWSISGLALAATSAVAAAAILLRFDRLSATLALFIEGQALFTLAWRSPAPLARWIALAVNALALGKLIFVDDGQNAAITWLGIRMNAVTPMGVLMALGFYFNRAVMSMVVYSWGATILVFLLIAGELSYGWIFAAWSVQAAILALAAARWPARDLRYQSYLLALPILAGLTYTMFERPKTSWIAWGIFALAYLAMGWLWRRLDAGRERAVALTVAWQFVGLGGATVLWILFPGTLTAPAWGLLALVMLEIGVLCEFRELRWAGHVVAAAGFGRLFMSNFPALGRTGVFSHRLLTVAPFIPLAYYLWSRTRVRLYLWAPPILALFLARLEIGRMHSGTGTMLAGLLLLGCGLRYQIVDLRWQAYLLAIAAFIRAWSLSFSLTETPLRLAAGLLVVAGLFAGHRLAPREALSKFERWARPAYAILGAALLAGILYNQVSGPLLTVAWSIEGVALLVLGFATAERVMRFSGLAFFLFCILKLFFYDLSSLQGLPRIASFIVLGVLLMAASWLYTRYREQLKRIL